MSKREYEENDRICGNCIYHKSSWEAGHLAGCGIAITSWQMRMDVAPNTRTERNARTLRARGR